MLQFVGLKTIFDVDDSLTKLYIYLLDYAVWLIEARQKEWKEKITVLGNNISLFYLCFLVSAESSSLEVVKGFYEKYNISDMGEDFGNYYHKANQLLQKYIAIKASHVEA